MEKIIWKKRGPMQYDTKNRFMIWEGKNKTWGLYKITPPEEKKCILLYEHHYMKDVKRFADKLVNL